MKKTVLIVLAGAAIFSSGSVAGDIRRLTAGDYSVSISQNGAVLSVEKKNGGPVKTAGPDSAGEIILGASSFPLARPASVEEKSGGLRFLYNLPSTPGLQVMIAYRLAAAGDAATLTREITLASPGPKPGADITVRLALAPFKLGPETWLPLKNGLGRPMAAERQAAYRFAGALRSDGVPLAIPMVSSPSKELPGRVTVALDPYYSALFSGDAVEWTYPKAVGLEDGREGRSINIVLHSGVPDDAMAAFFRTALPDVPPGPGWLRAVAMVDYDYLGRYTFDRKAGKLDTSWTAFSNYPNVKKDFPSNVPVAMTLKDVHRRLAYARSCGFRVALYFADGMNAGEGLADIYAPDCVLRWGGWQGPDTKGRTYVQNPLCPEVHDFFLDYVKALLAEYGRELDALVWDETFHVPEGSLGSEARPGYADRAMMRLTRDITAEVRAFNRRAGREVAFMASDCIGVFNWVTKPPYALVADGTYQDTHCAPEAWSYGVFPNYRNVLWSCNWEPVTHWDYTEFGVRNYQTPVAISNGWGDYCGFAAMSPGMKKKVLELFDWRKRFATRFEPLDKLPLYRGSPVVKSIADETAPGISFLSWDTEGGDKADVNVLRADAAVRLQFPASGAWHDALMKKRRVEESGAVVYDLEAGGARLMWKIEPGAIRGAGGDLKLVVSAAGSRAASARLLFPFDPKATSTTVLPGAWQDDGTFRLPAVVNAPDFGSMLVKEAGGREVRGRLEGSRKDKIVDLTLEFPEVAPGQPIILTLTPLLLPPPPGLRETGMWPAARRGWLNALQPCARWGEQNKPFSSPPGILGNNVISDPASMSLWFYADQALFLPEPAAGVSLMPLVRRTIDYWLDQRMRRDEKGRRTGEITGYWDYGNFLDANASPLIAAWDYVEATGDLAWLRARIERLELAADFLARRDVDHDGFVEAVQSGNRGTLHQPNRSCAWWDALNCGHKDGYTNALIYRAWSCLAELERKLDRNDRGARYAGLAGKLKAVYAKTLYNPRTGWLAWWKSADGELHDYASPTLNGLAIEYGLVDPALGRQILDRLWKKIAEAGFTRFDLGVPPVLIPVHRSDYLQPDAIGIPKREDGTDTFGWYMNGGITAGHVLHFLAAHYVLGEPERADRVLRAMLERQARGEFQNGVRDAGGEGIDWTMWDGKPSGYEGYLADSFRFLQAVLLREPEFRARLYRPWHPANNPEARLKDDRAAQVLAKVKQASGGAAWDGIRSVHVKAKFATGGLNGTGESWEDTLSGRACERFALGPMKGVEGFDGKTVWSQDTSGQANADEGEDTRLRAASEAYRRTMAYWYPERREGVIEYAGEKAEGGRHFHVVRITPKGGRAFDIWVDGVTWLFDRVVEKAALETQTTYFSDYRDVAGVKMAFVTRRTNGETRYDQTVTAESVDINVPIDDTMFTMPAAAPKDFAIAGGLASTTVPFTLVNGHIYLQVKLDGQGPFLVLCDTGGANIVTPDVAKSLGLASAGAIQGRGVGEKSEDVGLTKVRKLEVGDASLADQVFAVYPLGGLAEAEGVAAQGLIGYEVFKRFVVEIDYERGRLTLVLPDTFTYKGSGTAVSFKFNDRIPQVEGEIDGVPGKFDIDTGSRASLTILAPFAVKHNLKERYGAKVEAVTGWGVGGSTRGLITRAGILKLGGVEVRGPVTELSLQTKGAFVDPYVAGNVGAGVLQRFNLIFDYGRGRIIFEPNANNARPDFYDRSGMWLNLSKGVFQIIDVVAGGPAAEEGLKKGDEILSMDGKTPGQITLAEARSKLRTEPAGTRVRLRVRSGGADRDVTVTLRDLIGKS
ncbi:MAG: aspartyl protease family protein [Candidatus Aminicenantales bacterium]